MFNNMNDNDFDFHNQFKDLKIKDKIQIKLDEYHFLWWFLSVFFSGLFFASIFTSEHLIKKYFVSFDRLDYFLKNLILYISLAISSLIEILAFKYKIVNYIDKNKSENKNYLTEKKHRQFAFFAIYDAYAKIILFISLGMLFYSAFIASLWTVIKSDTVFLILSWLPTIFFVPYWLFSAFYQIWFQYGKSKMMTKTDILEYVLNRRWIFWVLKKDIVFYRTKIYDF
ncbi:hypothetical protein [Mesomycoplasma lagogenitalium]|uniref:Uncharacterized protein n=1 Tax=Mesomycoplasma lagogenitalium TaxID=171286 RepID=A0ABY8LU31_9BACT|nr:hypothetical protein [Mesomycoplasma lagogenitalium]WGI36741.1 hypothetical protein QEG99_00425 [Mesomycoplasma lagogenitalium]